MDFFEAMQAMQKGAKVRIPTWAHDKYIGITEESVKVFGQKRTKYTVINQCEIEISACVPFSALVTADWELYKENDVMQDLANLIHKIK